MPLHLAASNGWSRTAEVLLKAKSIVDPVDGKGVSQSGGRADFQFYFLTEIDERFCILTLFYRLLSPSVFAHRLLVRLHELAF